MRLLGSPIFSVHSFLFDLPIFLLTHRILSASYHAVEHSQEAMRRLDPFSDNFVDVLKVFLKLKNRVVKPPLLLRSLKGLDLFKKLEVSGQVPRRNPARSFLKNVSSPRQISFQVQGITLFGLSRRFHNSSPTAHVFRNSRAPLPGRVPVCPVTP